MANPNASADHLPKWKPGQSGNPAGSSKKQRIASELMAILAEAGKKGAPTLREVCLGLLERAKAGDVAAFNATADRIDGKVAQPVEVRDARSPIVLPANNRGKPANGNGRGNGKRKRNGNRAHSR